MSRLHAWLGHARVIEARRCSAARYAALDKHWAALTVPMLREAPQGALVALLGSNIFHKQKPTRGFRRGTHWELVNVEARNRLARLAQEADRASMGLGDNARRAA